MLKIDLWLEDTSTIALLTYSAPLIRLATSCGGRINLFCMFRVQTREMSERENIERGAL